MTPNGADQSVAAGDAVRPGVDAEHPAAVGWVADKIRGWIGQLGGLWIEGQIAELNIRRDVAFLTLRDLAQEKSLPVFLTGRLVPKDGGLAEGDRVLVQGKPEFWVKRGELRLRATQLRKVGLGELLEQLERLRAALDAEGLFRPERKRPLPFLPTEVGLISGRESDAQRDVITHARNRWPAARFAVRNTAVQGTRAVPEIIAALQELDAADDVDVIVIARGGGSVEDLLPFSNEALIRQVAAARTPVVSAIGHERDAPLLDLVADWRASTPTDAGKRVVPDFAEEVGRVRDLRVRARRALLQHLEREERTLRLLRDRPVLADPTAQLAQRGEEVVALLGRGRRSLLARVDHDRTDVSHLRSRVRALSPAATLDRGYAVVQQTDGSVVRDPAEVAVGDPLRIRVAAGAFTGTRTDGTGAPT
jgi:exodeoxyribonuclease VII large subunit